MRDDAEIAADIEITFHVKVQGDKQYTVTMAKSASVYDLKTKLAAQEFGNMPIENQRLIYLGRVLRNNRSLAMYDISINNLVHLVRNATSNITTGPSAPSRTIRSTVPQSMDSGATDYFNASSGTGAFRSGERAAQGLLSPSVVQRANDLLDSPTFVNHLIRLHPFLANKQNAREMLQSSFFRYMMISPEVIQDVARRSASIGGTIGQEWCPPPGTIDTMPSSASTGDDMAVNGTPEIVLGGIEETQGDSKSPGTSILARSPNAMEDMLFQEFSRLGVSTLQVTTNDHEPQTQYVEKLRILDDMGFHDVTSNVAALRRSGGSVEGAIEELIGES